MYRCFYVNCLFENFSLNFPLLSGLFYFLKKENKFYTFLPYTHIYCEHPLINLPSTYGITSVLKPFSNTLKSLQTWIELSRNSSCIYSWFSNKCHDISITLFLCVVGLSKSFLKIWKAKPSPYMNLKFVFTIHLTVAQYFFSI